MSKYWILILLMLSGCKSSPSFNEQIDLNLTEQYNKGRQDYVGVVTNQAGTLGKYWNWRAGYLAGSLSHNHFLIQGNHYTYHVAGLNVAGQPFLGLDSEVKFESLNQLIESEMKKSKSSFESKDELKYRIEEIKKVYPHGRFIVTVYGSTIESVSNNAIEVIIAQDGKKVAHQKIGGVGNIPGVTGLWWNMTVLKSPNLNGKPFTLRVYQEFSNRLSDYNFELK